MLFNYHLLYFCTALSLIIMLSSHYYLHKSKTLSQLTQCPFTGTLLLFLTFGKTGRAPDNCICPLGKVLTYKNLIYLLNFPVSVPHVQNAPSVALSLAVGGRLQKFWQKWLDLGANPRVVSILKEGYTLPFKMRPPLARSPVVLSGYANPVRNRHLKEALLALMQKLVVEKVVIRSSQLFMTGYS